MTMPDERATSEKQNHGQIVGTRDNSDASSSSKMSCSTSASIGESDSYWKAQYDTLLEDYNRLQKLNQNLEDKLLNIVDVCEKNKQELVANIEYEKSTLMADVNKLSTKLVDARIRLHDYEEKELMHAAECNSPCHKGGSTKDQTYDPNLV